MKPKTYLEIRAFLLDGGRTRKALRNAPDAPLYVADSSPDDEFYVLTPRGLDEAERYLALRSKARNRLRQRNAALTAGQRDT